MTIDHDEIEQSLRQLRPEPPPLLKDERHALRQQLFTQINHRETKPMKRFFYYLPSAAAVGALLLIIGLLALWLTDNRLGIEGSVRVQTGENPTLEQPNATATPLPVGEVATALTPTVAVQRTLRIVGTTPPTGAAVVIDAQTTFSVTVAYVLDTAESADLQIKLTDVTGSGGRGVGGANLTIARGSGEVTVVIQPDYQELGNAERLGLWLTLLDPATGQPILIDHPEGYYWTVAR